MDPRWSQIKEWRDDWEIRKRDFEAIGVIAESVEISDTSVRVVDITE